MMLPKLLCYYPTNVAIVDDSNSFLAMMDSKLNSKQSRQLYNNPAEAIDKINKIEKSRAQLARILNNLSTIELNELPTGHSGNPLLYIDLKHLYEEVNNSKRFDRISVVLVDYNMPQINGIEFCRNLSDKAIIKIMITDLSDYELAVQAFNDGVIDRFILKNTPSFFNEVNSSIIKAQRDYFKNIYGTNGILGCIFCGQLQFATQAYYDLIEDVATTCESVECYLLDKSGSALFLNDHAEPTWLIMKTQSELAELYAIAKDNQASKHILDALYKREKMPILLSEKDYQMPVSSWKMYSIKPLESKEKSYYAVIKDQHFDLIDTAKITSFQRYIKDNPGKFHRAK